MLFRSVDISCGRDFSLALNSSGAIFSWGSDGHGCLGNGTSRADQWDPGVLHDIPEMAWSVLFTNCDELKNSIKPLL